MTDKSNWFQVPSEEWREYVSSDGSVYRIESAKAFWVSPRGTHYVEDAIGVIHTIMASAFKVCRFYDTKGISITAPRDK